MFAKAAAGASATAESWNPNKAADNGGNLREQELQESLRQLALQTAIADDLSFAYQLQLEEVLRASAEKGLQVSPRLFAAESEECSQRRAAVDPQIASLADSSMSSSQPVDRWDDALSRSLWKCSSD